MPASSACAHPAHRSSDPERPRWEIADVIRLYGDTYRQTHRVSPAQHQVLDALVACRTAQLGGHAECCPQCGFARYAYSSCRNRHCPKCQTLTKARWLEDRTAELLPVPYFHTVFTLSHTLNPLLLGNKRPLLALLFQAASQTLSQFGRQNLGGQMAATMILHTWDQLLNAHFHVHCLVPGGALVADGPQWVPTHPRFLFPVQALGTVFRAKFLETFHTLATSGQLTFAAEWAALGSSEGLTASLDQLYAPEWVVYAKPPWAGPKQVLEYLGRYTHRVAIANHRLVDVRDGHVRFTYRDRRQGHRQQIMTLEAHAFLARFLLHLVPLGFVRIRHYGFLSNRCKARTLRQCRQLLGQLPEPPPREPKTVAQWMQQWRGLDITRCPHCGHQPLLRTLLPVRGMVTWTRAPPRPACAEVH